MAYTPDSHLTFSLPPAVDGHLTFGADEVPVSATGTCTVSIRLPKLRVSAHLRYDNRVHRGPAMMCSSRIHGGVRVGCAISLPLRPTDHYCHSIEIDWKAASHVGAMTCAAIDDGVRQAVLFRAGWKTADGIAAGVYSVWRVMERTRAAVEAGLRDADSLSAQAQAGWQDGERRRKGGLTAWQEGSPLRLSIYTRASSARPMAKEFIARWQDGAHPAIGCRAIDPVIPPGPVCYQRSAHLTFKWPTATDGHLTFVCDNALAPGEPKRIIPIRSAYIVINNVTLIRVDTSRELVSEALDISVDADSWTCSWSATLAWSEFDALRAERGQPVELLASINGHSYKLLMEGAPARNRSFGKWGVTVKGRGIAAALDSPYQDVSVRSNPSQAMTAQQIMADALMINGVSNGWSLDWQITDWLVPAGAWSHQGTPIAAVLEVASAVGAIVQSADAAKTLRILPRYPIKPWAWSSANPDIQIPLDVTATDSVEPIIRPAYNAVIVGGQAYGLTSTVKRTGTAGDVPAPAVTHPLLTAPEATLQRGLAILGDTGAQERIGMSLPLSGDTGLIRLNMLADVPDPDDPWRGLVRNVALSARWGDNDDLVVWQNIGLERHYAD